MRMTDEKYWEMYECVISGETVDKEKYKKLVEWLCERHAIDEIMDLIWHEDDNDKWIKG